ncbi:MAG TPA: hypothetical protein VKG24_17540 [Pseudolabrys sp.]|nr:hypothetical protein [Pseudolabrys sp.]
MAALSVRAAATVGRRLRRRRVARVRREPCRWGLSEVGYIEGQNVTVEYHWLAGQYDRLPSLMADLVRRRVAVIATPGSNLRRLRPKLRPQRSRSFSASPKILLSLVWSAALPGRAATGPALILSLQSWWPSDWALARLGAQGRSDCRAGQYATTAGATLRDIPEAARALGLQIQVLNANTSREIVAAFASLWRERADTLFDW